MCVPIKSEKTLGLLAIRCVPVKTEILASDICNIILERSGADNTCWMRYTALFSWTHNNLYFLQSVTVVIPCENSAALGAGAWPWAQGACRGASLSHPRACCVLKLVPAYVAEHLHAALYGKLSLGNAFNSLQHRELREFKGWLEFDISAFLFWKILWLKC